MNEQLRVEVDALTSYVQTVNLYRRQQTENRREKQIRAIFDEYAQADDSPLAPTGG